MPTHDSTLIICPLTYDPSLLGLRSDWPAPLFHLVCLRGGEVTTGWHMLHCQACTPVMPHNGSSPWLLLRPHDKGTYHKATGSGLVSSPLPPTALGSNAVLTSCSKCSTLFEVPRGCGFRGKFSLMHQACSINQRIHTWNEETNGTANLSSVTSSLLLDVWKEFQCSN